MKKFLLFVAVLWMVPSLHAQIASTECIVEARAVYSHIDHRKLLNQDEPTRINYVHEYIMRSDAAREKVRGEESRIYARNFMYHDSPDYEECTDATEAFNFRKFQFVVYRTKSTLDKAGIIPGLDAGIFDHCLVRTCEFIPAPGRDSTSFKKAFMSVDDAGQKKYQVSDLEMVWEPVNGDLIAVTVNFTERSRTVWASYSDLEFSPAENTATSAAAIFLSGDGLADQYKGVGLKDYR